VQVGFIVVCLDKFVKKNKLTEYFFKTDFSLLYPYLLYFFFAITALQLYYLWGIFGWFAFYRKKTKPLNSLPISVVICAKNEYQNLKVNLPAVLKQDYPDFEVVIVNDASDDETIFLLQDLEREYPHLRVVNIPQDLNFFKGKKFPLSIGIKSAKHEHLLLTDADCLPAGPNWIREMAGNFDQKTEIVLGYGQYQAKGNLLNVIIRFETMMTAIQYFSYAIIGLPYMGVGRNLAYKKSLFMKNNGFISHYKIPSGDDDLFINQVANRKNTRIEVNPGSFTVSAAKESFLGWWMQKRRHLTTGKFYKRKHKFLLGLYSGSLMLFYLVFVLLLILKFSFILVIGAFSLRLLSMLIIFKKSMIRLNEKKLLLISPIIELLLLGIYPVIILANQVIREKKWK
jgi:glycosyltransferase involved in cell wall biosynthesis